MKRSATLIALLTLLAVPQAFAGGGFIKSLTTAQKLAKEKNRLIFVDLFAQWCGWCHRFEAEVVPSEAFQKATEKMVLLRLDTEDGGEGTKFARQFQVNSLPTFMILNPDLSVAAVIKGYAPPTQFVQMMNGALEKNAAFRKLVDQEPKLGKDYEKRLQIASEFRERQDFASSEPRLKKLISERGVPAAFRDQAYYELAQQYMQQKKTDQVISTVNEFGKVQSKGEPYERSRLLIVDVFLSQGNWLGAVNELKKFKAAFPNSSMMPNVDNVLKSLERQLAK